MRIVWALLRAPVVQRRETQFYMLQKNLALLAVPSPLRSLNSTPKALTMSDALRDHAQSDMDRFAATSRRSLHDGRGLRRVGLFLHAGGEVEEHELERLLLRRDVRGDAAAGEWRVIVRRICDGAADVQIREYDATTRVERHA
jgi:hypothetical protein